MSGLFSQIWLDGIGKYSQGEFDELIEKLKSDGLETFYIQYSAYDGYSWYISSQEQFIYQEDVISKIVNSCERNGMYYVFGLDFDSDWEDNIIDPKFLSSLQEHSIKTAEELYTLYGSSEYFQGYYTPYEMDDIIMLQNDNFKLFTDYYLSGLSETLKKRTDFICVAPYFSNSDVNELSMMWDYILENSSITDIMLQNGDGTHRVSNEIDAPIYFNLFQNISKEHNRNFWAVIELFNQTHGYPVDNEVFDAMPMTIERYKTVVETLDNYTNNLVGFSLSYYLSEIFRSEYLAYHNSLAIENTTVDKQIELSVYPNPFNPVTTILLKTSNMNVSVSIYDVKGRVIKSYHLNKQGLNSINFNGSRLSSGVYFVKAISGNSVLTQKMILIK